MADAETEREQALHRLQEVRDENSDDPVVQEVAGMAEMAVKAICECRSQRDRLVKAVEEAKHYLGKATCQCDGSVCDGCRALRVLREALEAVEGDGVERGEGN